MRISLLLVCLLSGLIEASEPVRITVRSGQQQIFEGFGGSGATFNGRMRNIQYPKWMPEAGKDTLNHLLWKDCQYTFFRLHWTTITTYDNEFIVNVFKDEIRRKLRYIPDLQIIFDPAGVMTSPDQWGKRIAEVIDTLEKGIKHPLTGENIKIAITGIGNEPNQKQYWSAAPIAAASVGPVVVALRSALDARGLTHVKVIAPGCSNMDQYMWDALASIKDTPGALDALYAYEYHSYNMSITQAFYEYMAVDGKKIFQSESSLPEGDGLLFNDSMSAAQTYTRFLADINFGIHNFLAWSEWREGGSGNSGFANGCETIVINSYTGEIRPYLKFYYLRQLSRTFVPGTKIRKSTTDLFSRTGRASDSLMEYNYGLKIPIAAAAGIRPDNNWVMAAINHTGIRFTDYGSTYYPKTDYSVTFYVPELADSGDIEFKVWRCNDGTRNEFDEKPALMRNGEVTVPLHHCDLVCLSTSFDTTFVPVPQTPQDQYTGGTCGNCGTGVGYAFFPPICFYTFGALRQRRRAKEVKRA